MIGASRIHTQSLDKGISMKPAKKRLFTASLAVATRPKLHSTRSLSVVAATLAIGALALTGCSAGHSSGGGSPTGLLTIPREDTATFTSNFNPFSPNALPMTQQAVYEPLLIVNPVKGAAVPWLGSSWKADPDGMGVTFTLRSGVKWSDGQPLTADDVVYTFDLQKKIQGGFDYLTKVSAVDPTCQGELRPVAQSKSAV
jgi:peptide/nickel transport system substrate-binding protein